MSAEVPEVVCRAFKRKVFGGQISLSPGNQIFPSFLSLCFPAAVAFLRQEFAISGLVRDGTR